MTTQIRPAQRKDLPELIEMITGLAAFHSDTPDVSRQQLTRDLFGPFPWFTVIVAEGPEGDLQGYAALIPTGQLQFGLRGMDMHHLFVRDSVRGMGLGTRLVKAAVAHAVRHGCAVMSVGTHPDNDTAGAFYKSQGFVQRGPSGPQFMMRLDSSAQPPT